MYVLYTIITISLLYNVNCDFYLLRVAFRIFYYFFFLSFSVNKPMATCLLLLSSLLSLHADRRHLPVDRRPTETSPTASVDIRRPRVESRQSSRYRRPSPQTGLSKRYATVRRATTRPEPSSDDRPRSASSGPPRPTSRPRPFRRLVYTTLEWQSPFPSSRSLPVGG